MTSLRSPGAARRNSIIHPFIIVSKHRALVTQLWSGFSKATQVLRTIRLWVIITLALTPKFPLVDFTPQALQFLSFLEALGSVWQFLFSDIILCYHPCQPLQGWPRLLLSLLFLRSGLLSLLLLFLGYFKLWREFFSCDYNSFFQFWLARRLCDYSSLGLLRLGGTIFLCYLVFFFFFNNMYYNLLFAGKYKYENNSSQSHSPVMLHSIFLKIKVINPREKIKAIKMVEKNKSSSSAP